MHRRDFLAAASAAFVAPSLSLACAATEQRFVVIILRGAVDGLHVLAPCGDPAYAAARGHLALSLEGQSAAMPVDGLFALHPGLPHTLELYRARQALFVHAVATPYRGRSHFDGQDVLEGGGAHAHQRRDGWLNRLLALLPEGRAIAVGSVVPLLLQGPHAVTSFAPAADASAADRLTERIAWMYDEDELLHPLWADAVAMRAMADEIEMAGHGLVRDASFAAAILSKAEGPRIAVLESGGWDTHANQVERLTRKLTQLDAALFALRHGLGSHWGSTVVAAITEFGRTVAPNGTGGTDHGTSTVVLLAGGAIDGGRVVADWPGLQEASLLDRRDLRPTIDLRAVLSTLSAEHFAIDPGRAASHLFPGLSDTILPARLVRC